VGFSQLVTTFPRASPGGTRPDATPPAIAPRKNGVTTDENANAAPNIRCCHTSVAAFRNANAEPRAITPSATSVSGMYRVEAIDANSGGNAVHISTRTKISQTWLASHTGPIECSISARRPAPRRVVPASRSQAPAPKSAPASRAYAVTLAHISASRLVARVTVRPPSAR
jgi:hypothetical protein